MTDTSPKPSAPAAPSAPIALLGCGMMGEAIGRRLLERGFRLSVWDRTPSRAATLGSAGAQVAATPRAAAKGASLALVMLRDGRSCRRVILGRGGVAAGLAPGRTVANLSTISPVEAVEIGEGLTAKGFGYLDAPVGGSVDAAARGELLLFAGGEPARLDDARPALESFTRLIERLGPVGAGSSMKLVNNMLSLAHVAILGDAVALAEASGLPRASVLRLLSEGGAASAMLHRKRAAIERREYPVQFKLDLAAKDAQLIDREARRRGLQLRLVREVRRRYETERKAGRGEEDFAAIIDPARPRAPVPPEPTGTPGPPA